MIGDVFSNLLNDADIGDLDMHLLGKLRRELNNIQQQVSGLSVLMDSTGNLDPNIFLHHSRGFSILPLPCASLYFDTQAITTGSFATPTTLTTADATWNYGMSVDTTNSYIQVHGTPGESVVAFICWWQWANDAGGDERWLKWTDQDGNDVFDLRTDLSGYAYNKITHVRRITAADTHYYMQVKHNKGSDLNGDGLFVAIRVR